MATHAHTRTRTQKKQLCLGSSRPCLPSKACSHHAPRPHDRTAPRVRAAAHGQWPTASSSARDPTPPLQLGGEEITGDHGEAPHTAGWFSCRSMEPRRRKSSKAWCTSHICSAHSLVNGTPSLLILKGVGCSSLVTGTPLPFDLEGEWGAPPL